MNSVLEIVTNRILAEMEKGVLPWERPWIVIPKQNMVTKRPYQGINRFLLAFETEEFYLSFNQVKQLGGKIKKGAKSQLVIFWKPVEVKLKEETEESKERDTYVILRYYNVFRLCDVEGIERPVIGKPNEKREDIEAFVKRINPRTEFGGSTACYNPKSDTICMPEINRFTDSNHYYSTLLHELAHWTGNEHRLKRFNQDVQNYHQEYGKEELTAELTAAILCHHFGIALPEHNAGYIQGWIQSIKGDNRLLIGASSRAEKVIEYLGLKI